MDRVEIWKKYLVESQEQPVPAMEKILPIGFTLMILLGQ